MNDDAHPLIDELKSLSASDFDDTNSDANGTERLDSICDRALALEDPSSVFPEFFGLMERLPDADLGSPGPLVHVMEKHAGQYEADLMASVHRKPTALTVWMVNRIVNANRADKQTWMDLLRTSAGHPEAPESVREIARGFLRLHTRS